MRSRIAYAMIAASMLAGCAGAIIKDKMASLAGQPINAAIDKLGFPTEQTEIAGRKVYIWSSRSFVEGTSYECKIRAIVDDHDTIINWDFEGNEGGCQRYAARLWRSS